MKDHLEKHGPAIIADMKAIVAYHVTELGGTDKEMTIFLDMRNTHGTGSGLVMIKENLEALPKEQ